MRMKWLQEYQCWVFDDGRVATPNNKGGLTFRKHHLDVRGYVMVRYSGNKVAYLHRLLALAFIPNPNNYPVVDHIDRNKQNYRLDNLRWATQKVNAGNCDRSDRSISTYGIRPGIDRKAYNAAYYEKHKELICERVHNYRKTHQKELHAYEQGRKEIKNQQRRERRLRLRGGANA